ncbi:GroES-like protein [Martensiomyces pterosporus]|nr:GroES-like protein [Martensiomyces pterosporus]
MAELMNAVVFKGPLKVSCEQVARPTSPCAGEAIVRVKACGLCGSDLHPYRGAEKGLRPGTICGHEFAGVVEEVGDGVRLAPGQRVAASFTTACGSCWFCTHSLSSRCDEVQLFGWVDTQTGMGIHGGQAQFVRVPNADGTLLTLPDDVSFEEGVLLGDILSTGYFCAKSALSALSELAMPTSQLTAAVVGCGPVGLCAILSARMLGFGTVYAIDRVKSRLDVAKGLGACVVEPGQSPVDAICSATDGRRGADAVLEVVGSFDALDLSFQLVRAGGVVSSVGVHAHDRGFPVSPNQCYDKNITYKCGRCPARSLMDAVCQLIRTSDIAQRVISHRGVPLSRAAEMYAKFESQQEGVLKVVFDPWAA